jgi:hypothetical protein
MFTRTGRLVHLLLPPLFPLEFNFLAFVCFVRARSLGRLQFVKKCNFIQ